ncbi:MAG TPA: threonine/serine exporter family protein [Xanthobacteraceae bacterium]
MTRPPAETATTLADALDGLLRFGASMLHAGDTAFRVREWMGVIARAMGVDALSVRVALGSIAATARRGGEHATLVREVAPPGINASRLGALEHLARNTAPGATARGLAAQVAAIEAEPPLYSIVRTAAAIGVASGAFSYLNGGGVLEVLAAVVGGGSGQGLRSLLFSRRFNQYAVTAACAVVASGIYCLITAAAPAVGLRAPDHAAGFISSVLFLVPGFPLVAALLDLLQHQTIAGITRLAYGTMLLLAAAFGLCIVAAAAGLTTMPPPPVQAGELVTLILRAAASFAGGCGFAILYNSSPRTVLAVGVLALIGNELRLAVHDAGMALAPATFLGALVVGLLASLARRHVHEPRIALTVPGIIIMVPGTYAFQTVVLFDQGEMLAAIQAAVLGGFVVGAMALGLAAARFVSERGWIVES